MTKNLIQTKTKEDLLYNNILLLSRNKLFYTKFNLADTFQNRIHLIFLHISFLFIKIKQNKLNKSYKDFHQKMFDLIFIRIEENMREIGYGDVIVNKNMKFLTKTFYNILLNCEKYKRKNTKSKKIFLVKYLEQNNAKNDLFSTLLVSYFNKYEAFCFDLKDDSVLKGDLTFNYI